MDVVQRTLIYWNWVLFERKKETSDTADDWLLFVDAETQSEIHQESDVPAEMAHEEEFICEKSQGEVSL